ncbi:hypothetical protein [Rhizosaccharibacter radicis]|uniref:Uncharacterized protein n=1 Tax=Rhizosaccharibacter radicis TaxID=2782605 RepID=A0ABT1VUW8_9PROT|nr:hypothetical protein [Acetobacteraceae bacterium KSS12]
MPRFPRVLLSAFSLLCIGATGARAASPAQNQVTGLATPGVDVRCLWRHRVVYEQELPAALRDCRTSKPDLTGNAALQQDALAHHVLFTIRPHDDAILKRQQERPQIGSLIPGVDLDGQLNNVGVDAPSGT